MPPCSPGRRRRAVRARPSTRARLARGQHSGSTRRHSDSTVCEAVRPAPALVSAPHATTIAATRAQPDPRLGAPGAHRRLDRPPARGHRPADPGFKREHELDPDGDAEGARRRLRRRDRPARRGRRADRRRARGRAERPRRADEDARTGRRATRRRRRRRAGAGAARRGAAARAPQGRRRTLEATFDHGDEGYGLWLDPAVQDDPVYAEHWAGHRPVEVAIEEDQIVIRRAGGDEDDGDAGLAASLASAAAGVVAPPRARSARTRRRPPSACPRRRASLGRDPRRDRRSTSRCPARVEGGQLVGGERAAEAAAKLVDDRVVTRSRRGAPLGSAPREPPLALPPQADRRSSKPRGTGDRSPAAASARQGAEAVAAAAGSVPGQPRDHVRALARAHHPERPRVALDRRRVVQRLLLALSARCRWLQPLDDRLLLLAPGCASTSSDSACWT